MAISTHMAAGKPAVSIVPPLDHIDLNSIHDDYPDAVRRAVQLSREHGWRPYDFTGRIDMPDLLAMVDGYQEVI